MGACSSCCKKSSGSSGGETEMTGNKNQQNGETSTTLALSRKMSAPTITITDHVKVSGHGLALANVVVEQDSAYWEWHITSTKTSDATTKTNGEEKQKEAAVKFGVATRKDQKFYRALAKSNGGGGEEEKGRNEDEDDGTLLTRAIGPLKQGDTVGVAVQQSGFPMIEFWLNGKELPDAAIDRFRGSVYPAIFLPQDSAKVATLVYQEDDFRQTAPHGPLLVARGLI